MSLPETPDAPDGSPSAKDFGFYNGYRYWSGRNDSGSKRAFAVRSRAMDNWVIWPFDYLNPGGTGGELILVSVNGELRTFRTDEVTR
jgi:hypothetical protein